MNYRFKIVVMTLYIPFAVKAMELPDETTPPEPDLKSLFARISALTHRQTDSPKTPADSPFTTTTCAEYSEANDETACSDRLIRDRGTPSPELTHEAIEPLEPVQFLQAPAARAPIIRNVLGIMPWQPQEFATLKERHRTPNELYAYFARLPSCPLQDQLYYFSGQELHELEQILLSCALPTHVHALCCTEKMRALTLSKLLTYRKENITLDASDMSASCAAEIQAPAIIITPPTPRSTTPTRMWTIDAATGHTQGPRPTDEDAHDMQRAPDTHSFEAYGIYDGHGGQGMAQYAKEHVLPTIATFMKNPEKPDVDGSLLFYAQKMFAIDTEKWISTQPKPFAVFQKRFAAMSHEEKAIFYALIKVDRDALDAWTKETPEYDINGDRHFPGSTVITTIIKDGVLYAGLLGDARAILADAHGSILWRTFDQSFRSHAGNMAKDELTETEHEKIAADVSHEQLRIFAAGSELKHGRVKEILALSRSLGDFHLRNGAIAIPEIFRFPASGTMPPTAKYLILACDGLWDVMSSEDAAKLVANHCALPASTAQTAANTLVKQALALGTQDNVTATVVILGHE